MLSPTTGSTTQQDRAMVHTLLSGQNRQQAGRTTEGRGIELQKVLCTLTFLLSVFFCSILFIVVTCSVNACVTDLNEAFGKNTEQTAPRIGSTRNATFSCQIRDNSVFYETGGNPRVSSSKLASANVCSSWMLAYGDGMRSVSSQTAFMSEYHSG